MEQSAVMSDYRIDGRIIEACQQGDRAAFRQLFEAYKNKVYSIALYFFNGEDASAKDITQSVFLKLFTKLGQFRNDAEFETWLYRLVVNTCMDEQRRRKRFVLFGDTAAVVDRAGKRSPEDHYIQIEIEDCVKAAIAELKPKLRMPVLLKYFEDLSYDEMARVLGCSTGTVASRLNRGHKILARKLAHLRGALASGV